MSHMPATPPVVPLGVGPVYVRDYGAYGNGTTDDTTALERAIATGRMVVGRPGDTYLVDGGLVVSTAGQVIYMLGCTVKLKNSATTKNILTLNAARARVFGGTWNMNAANNASGSVFAHSAVLLSADYTVAENMYVHDSYGIGIGGPGNASYREVRQCRLENCAGYGVFIDGPTTADAIGTRIVGCTVITTETTARGLYIQSLTPFTYQSKNWIVQGNVVIGPSSNSTAVGITVSGIGGLIEGNHVRNWDIGISVERSVSTRNVVNSNRVETDYVSYGGIEVVGGDCVISSNYVRGYQHGIVGSTQLGTGSSIDGNVYVGNRIHDPTIYGLYILAEPGDTARRQNIIGNTITASTMVNGLIRMQGDVSYSLIQGNNLKGTGSGVAFNRGLFLSLSAGNVTIRGNRFAGLERACTLYNNTGAAYANVTFDGNDVSEDIGGGSELGWLNLEGTATYGARVRAIDNFAGEAVVYARDLVDASNNVIARSQTNVSTPEAQLTGGPGSVYEKLQDGSRWVKASGTGNTGWKPIYYVPRTAPTYGANITIDTLAAGGEFVVTATNNSAFQINNPSTPVTGARITVRIRNTSGGALGAVTWDTAYKLATWTQPANGFSRAIDFQYDGTNWIEVSRTPADVPN